MGGKGSNSPLLSTGCEGAVCHIREDVIDAVMNGDTVAPDDVTGSADVMDDVMACADVTKAFTAGGPESLLDTLPLRLLRSPVSEDGLRLGCGRVAEFTAGGLDRGSAPRAGDPWGTSVICVICEVTDLVSRPSP